MLFLSPALLAVTAGAAIWEVFKPGILDTDGMGQLQIAKGIAPYQDWWSPLLPLSMAWALQAGCGIAGLTLLQAVAGSTGVYRMAAEVLRFITRGRRPDWEMHWGGLAVLALLLNPFCPLMYYLVHYRNDSLAAIFLTWAIAGWLRVARLWNNDPRHIPLGRKLLPLLAATAGSIMVIVVRYNAVLMLPVFLLFLALAVGRISRLAAAVTAVALIVGPFAVHEGLVRLSGANRTHPQQQIIGLELVGMCVEQEDLRSKLPYTSRYLVEDRYRNRYIAGNASPLFQWWGESIVREGYMGGNFARLSNEYRQAILTAPGTWLAVKIKAAAASLLDQTPYWHWNNSDPNPFGIAFSDDLRFIRSSLLAIDSGIQADPVLRFLCGRHLPWLMLNLILIILAGIAVGLARTRGSVLLLVLLLCPMAYYVSHLVAVANHDYRYMYPATLLMQILAACAAGERAVRWVHAQVLAPMNEKSEDRPFVVPANGDRPMAPRPPKHAVIELPRTIFVSSRGVE
jgi:hypothetical protein